MQSKSTEMLNPPFGNFFFLSLNQCYMYVTVALTHVETAFNLGLTIIVWLLKTGRQTVLLCTISLYRLALGPYYSTWCELSLNALRIGLLL